MIAGSGFARLKTKDNGRHKAAANAGERGAAALEYILVSTFAAVIAVAALAFVGKIIKDELAAMAAKLGVSEVPEITTNPLAPN